MAFSFFTNEIILIIDIIDVVCLSVCLPVCISVSLSLSLSVCLSGSL